MTVSLFTFVNLFYRQLDNAANVLAKGAEFARAEGVAAADMLDWRLIGDMAPLRFQLMVVCNFTRLWPARVAGLPLPAEIEQTSLDGYLGCLQVCGYIPQLIRHRAHHDHPTSD